VQNSKLLGILRFIAKMGQTNLRLSKNIHHRIRLLSGFDRTRMTQFLGGNILYICFYVICKKRQLSLKYEFPNQRDDAEDVKR